MFPFIYNSVWLTDDKVLHIIVWFFVSLIIYIYIIFYKKSQHKLFLAYAVFVLLIVGILKEVSDYFRPWHNVEIMDIIANYVGFVLFIWVKELMRIISSVCRYLRI